MKNSEDKTSYRKLSLLQLIETKKKKNEQTKH